MESYLFERCFVAVAFELGIKQYGSVMAFAKSIWPEKEEKSAAQTLYAIQGKSSKTGKPQMLRLHEAVKIVGLLEKAPAFPSFCFEISEKIRLGWTPNDELENPGGQAVSNGEQEKKEAPAHNAPGRPIPALEADATHIN